MILGERSESSLGSRVEKFVLPRMPITSILIYFCQCSYTGEYTEGFMDSTDMVI